MHWDLMLLRHVQDHEPWFFGRGAHLRWLTVKLLQRLLLLRLLGLVQLEELREPFVQVNLNGGEQIIVTVELAWLLEMPLRLVKGNRDWQLTATQDLRLRHAVNQRVD